MEDQLKKALEVAKRTGDRVIMVDGNDRDKSAYVIMNIDEYERMLSYKEDYTGDIKDLTEEQLIDKINDFLEDHQKKKEKAKDQINQFKYNGKLAKEQWEKALPENLET